MIDKIISKLSETGKISLFESASLCAAISFAGGFMFYDSYYFYMGIFRVIVTALIFVTWAACATLSGKKKQWGFLVFSACYWIIPLLFRFFYYNRENADEYNKYLFAANQFCDIWVNKPFEAVARSFHIEGYLLLIFLAVVIVIAFYLGLRISEQESETDTQRRAITADEAEIVDYEGEYGPDENEDADGNIGDFEDLNSFLNNIDYDD